LPGAPGFEDLPPADLGDEGGTVDYLVRPERYGVDGAQPFEPRRVVTAPSGESRGGEIVDLAVFALGAQCGRRHR
jgi:hypothetical protein